MDAKVGHLRRYTRSHSDNRVRAAGFTVESCAYVDSLGSSRRCSSKSSTAPANQPARPAPLRSCVLPLSRIVDSVTGRWFGKNLLLIAH